MSRQFGRRRTTAPRVTDPPRAPGSKITTKPHRHGFNPRGRGRESRGRPGGDWNPRGLLTSSESRGTRHRRGTSLAIPQKRERKPLTKLVATPQELKNTREYRWGANSFGAVFTAGAENNQPRRETRRARARGARYPADSQTDLHRQNRATRPRTWPSGSRIQGSADGYWWCPRSRNSLSMDHEILPPICDISRHHATDQPGHARRLLMAITPTIVHERLLV